MTQLAHTLHLAADFTSGNVRERLRRVKVAAALDASYEAERGVLEAVVPEDIPIASISIGLGASWIDPTYIEAFIQETLLITTRVTYVPVLGSWAVEALSSVDTLENKNVYGLIYEDIVKKKGKDEYEEKSVEITGLELIGRALNLQQPDISVRKAEGQPKEQSIVLTTQALSKMEQLQDKFAAWCRSDPDRAAKLEKVYNDRFNSLRLRAWDGAHLTLHGMSNLWKERLLVRTRKYQTDGIAMGIAIGGGIFYEVGLGKTPIAIAIAYERKRIGNCRKPIIVVQKSTLEQFVKTITEMYPSASVLMAGEHDLAKGNRQLFFARARAIDWDFTVVTHDQFERIAVSDEFARSFYNDRISQLESALYVVDPEYKAEKPSKYKKPSVKQIERRLRTLRQKVERMAEKKDEGLTWEQLGFDLLLYDEYDRAKNLGYWSKMENVVGLGSQDGSDRSFDFEMKRRWLQKTYGKNRLVGLTGTPISNTMAEMWKTMMDFAPDLMEEYGWSAFDAWAAQNGEVVTQPEVKHTGKIKMTNRFARFVNLPEMLTAFYSFARVVRSTDEGIEVDKPQAKRYTVKCAMSEFQQEMSDRLIERAELCEADAAIKWCPLYWFDTRNLAEVCADPKNPELANFEFDDTGMSLDDTEYRKALLEVLDHRDLKQVDPVKFRKQHGDHIADLYLRSAPRPHWDLDEDGCESDLTYKMTTDNMLSISTYGRLLSADQRLVDWAIKHDPSDQVQWSLRDFPKSKVNQCVRRVYGIYKRTRQQRATQVIFCDLSTPKGEDFSIYQALKVGLMVQGMPADQIAFIHDYDTDKKKAALWDAMNNGDMAVLIASSEKGGVGVNIQERLLALHHLDAPWRPRELEQREGRILRPGNRNPKVFIYNYITQGFSGNCGFDSFLWQLLEAKFRFIYAILGSGKLDVRHMEEDASDSPVFDAATIKALSTGNMDIIEYVGVENELRKVKGLIQGAKDDTQRLLNQSGNRSIARRQELLERHTQERELMNPVMPTLASLVDGCTNDNYQVTINGEVCENKTAAGRAIWQAIDACTENHEAYCNKYLTLGNYGGIDLLIYVGRNEVYITKDDQLTIKVNINAHIYMKCDWGHISIPCVKSHHEMGQKLETQYLGIFDRHVKLKSLIERAKQDLEKAHQELARCQDNIVTLTAKKEELSIRKIELEASLGITPQGQDGTTVVAIGFDEDDSLAA